MCKCFKRLMCVLFKLFNTVSVVNVDCFRFSMALASGLLEVIAPSPVYYPNLDNIKQTHGDSKERTK